MGLIGILTCFDDERNRFPVVWDGDARVTNSISVIV